MILRILEEQINDFENYLLTKAKTQDEPLFFYENLIHFQNNWDVLAEDFHLMLDKSIYNSQTKRIWFEPKKALLEFVGFNEGFVRMMFKDLFDETKSLSGRIDRFQFYSDELIEEMRLGKTKSMGDHFQHTEIIYFYLAMRYPSNYGVYQHNYFEKTLHIIKAKDIPTVFDPERYYKSSKIFNKYLCDKPLIDKHIERLLKGSNYFKQENMLRVSYFCWYCANHNF